VSTPESIRSNTDSASAEPTATGSSRTSARETGELARGLCAFWLGGHCYGLEIGLVGGMVQVEGLVPVPRAPETVLGLFNLRGAALPLVDLARVLSLPVGEASAAGPHNALVLHVRGTSLAVPIDRMEGVFKLERGQLHPGAAHDEHPAVHAVFTLSDRRDFAITVLSSRALAEALQRQKFKRTATSR
jgi:chemotaxis signal transduction protein